MDSLCSTAYMWSMLFRDVEEWPNNFLLMFSQSGNFLCQIYCSDHQLLCCDPL